MALRNPPTVVFLSWPRILLLASASPPLQAVLTLLPIIPVERPVLHRLGDVLGLDLLAAGEARNGARDFQDPVVRRADIDCYPGIDSQWRGERRSGVPSGE